MLCKTPGDSESKESWGQKGRGGLSCVGNTVGCFLLGWDCPSSLCSWWPAVNMSLMSLMIQCMSGAQTQARNKSYENMASALPERNHMGLSVGPLTMSRECTELWNELFLSPVIRMVVLRTRGKGGCQVKGLQSFWLEQPFILQMKDFHIRTL